MSTGLSDKAQLATDNYINNCIVKPIEGYTWAQAMRDAKYAETTIDSNSKDTWGLMVVQEQIDAARAKIANDTNVNRDYCIKQAKDILESSTNERSRLTAISLLADFIGAKRDTAPNAEREAGRAQRLTEEERELARAVAQVRTEQEAAKNSDSRPPAVIKLKTGS